MRYTRDLFENNYKATIGVDFEVEKYSIMDVPFTLQMWDTAGSERFQCIASAYYRGANSVVICFDYSKINTLNEARKWLDQAVAENPKQEVRESYSGRTLVVRLFSWIFFGQAPKLSDFLRHVSVISILFSFYCFWSV